MDLRRLAWVAGLGIALVGCEGKVEPLGQTNSSETTGASGSTASSTTASTGSSGSSGTTGAVAPLCAPCDQPSDCGPGGLCSLDPNASGGFCFPPCSDDSDCPSDARCVNGISGMRCQPNSGSCEEGSSSSASSASSSGSSGSVSSASSSSSSGSTASSSSSSGSTGHSSSSSGSTGHSSSSSGSTGHSSSSSGTTGTSSSSSSSTTGSSGSSGGVGPQGGTVDLLKFAFSGDTRPPQCNDTANYPQAIINDIATAEKAAGAQFALDLGDHMFVCNNNQATATAQMNKFMTGVTHFGGTWFMTEGNHECMGAGSGHCPLGSTNVNYNAFLNALAPIASKPYYKRNVHTRLGLATFVFIADNSWDSAQETWLENTLATADGNAKYTIICKHHPEGDTSVAANTDIMKVIRRHKFALLLTGHAHQYTHQNADNGRDLIMGLGGAPFSGGANYHGYGIVDQRSGGKLRVSIYDVHTGTMTDQWTVDPN